MHSEITCLPSLWCKSCSVQQNLRCGEAASSLRKVGSSTQVPLGALNKCKEGHLGSPSTITTGTSDIAIYMLIKDVKPNKNKNVGAHKPTHTYTYVSPVCSVPMCNYCVLEYITIHSELYTCLFQGMSSHYYTHY